MNEQANIDYILNTAHQLVRSASSCVRNTHEFEQAMASLETFLADHIGDGKTVQADQLDDDHRQRLVSLITAIARLEVDVTARLAWLDSLYQHLIDSLEKNTPE